MKKTIIITILLTLVMAALVMEANKDKPVKYLYITDDTPEQCKSFLEPNNIKGEHIHVTRAE